VFTKEALVPIYEYTCDGCDEITEALQKISESPLTTCENCGGSLTKKISNSTFILKGTGWYVTDYGDKKNGSGSDEKLNLKGANGDGKDGEKVAKSEKAPKGEVKDTAKMTEKPKEKKSESAVKAS
jgi:putative FmdB family regulatory protein